MKKILFALCIVALASLSFAQSTTAHSKNNADFPVSFSKHTQKFAYDIQGDSLITTVSGLNNLDSAHTVLCPGTSGNCLLQADEWIQAGNVSFADSVAICFIVDGNDINGCYYAGATRTDNGYTIYSTSQGIVVPFGNHTVQTQLFTASGGEFVDFFNFTYRVYKP
jgi:predicted HAD superfamily hydrolase